MHAVALRPIVPRPFVARLAVIGALCLVAAPAVAGGDGCPWLPEYRRLQSALPTMSPDRAVAALQRHAATHENPEGCEAADIDRRLASLERRQFHAVDGRRQHAPQAVFRCNQLEPATGRCTGPMEDGSAQIDGQRLGAPVRFAGDTVSLTTRRPDARLVGVYLTTPADLLDGRPPAAPTRDAAVRLPEARRGGVLMAIYETPGPWRYRKVVWLF